MLTKEHGFPVKNNIVTNSEEETANAANLFSSQLTGNEVIAINGELGAGKTFFIRHMLKNFGITNVSSPTFSLVNEYNGKFRINHFDFYRINKIEELYDIGFDEYINDSSLTIIEWAELFPEILPLRYIEISIKVIGDFKREITINKLS
jgi:tRNA threonylcarbamoyladenosine biosynthesis protein TsaE